MKLTRRSLGITFVLAPLGRSLGVPVWRDTKGEAVEMWVKILTDKHWQNLSLGIVNGTVLPDAQFSKELVSYHDLWGGGDGDGDDVRRVQEGDQEQGRDRGEIHGDDDDGPVQPEVGPV